MDPRILEAVKASVLTEQEARLLWKECLQCHSQGTDLPESVHPLMWRVLLWECPASPVLH